jgi:hypothetical protein
MQPFFPAFVAGYDNGFFLAVSLLCDRWVGLVPESAAREPCGMKLAHATFSFWEKNLLL